MKGATLNRVRFVIVCNIEDADGWNGSAAEVTCDTMVQARDTMRSLVGATVQEVLTLPNADPDDLGYEARYADSVVTWFTIATYERDEGTIDNMEFDSKGRWKA